MILSLLLLSPLALPSANPTEDAQPSGVVSHIEVLSDKVPDVSSLEAWRHSFLKDGMTDQEKALAVWRSTVMFQHQDAPPYEYLTNEHVVQDPFKIFNVYGYSFCSVASCDIECLARYAGLRARSQHKQDVHVVRKPQETYTIHWAVKPVMKSIVLELAE
jgi:hypothetical protein